MIISLTAIGSDLKRFAHRWRRGHFSTTWRAF